MITAFLCLAMTVYYEARAEPVMGQYAVAEVVMNRKRDPRFPDTVCGVVKHRYPGQVCQFSFWCDGKPENPKEGLAWRQAQAVATAILDDETVFVGDSLYFHAEGSKAGFFNTLEAWVMIGNHIFYIDKPED